MPFRIPKSSLGQSSLWFPPSNRGPTPKITHGKWKGLDKTFVGYELVLEITYGVDPRLLLSKRNTNKHLRVVNKQTLMFWHEKIKPGHFTKKGFTKYKYQHRTKATNLIKREKFGHVLPIKQKGLAQSMTDNVKTLRATPTKGRLVMYGPWYLGHRQKRQRGGLSPDLKDELTRVDMRDAQRLAEKQSKALTKLLEADRRKGIGAHKVRPRKSATP